MEYNFREIEKKWQKRWVENKTYQVTEDETKKKFYVLNMPSGSEQPGQAGTVLGGTAGFAGGRGRDVQKEWVCGHEKMPVGIHERANTIRL